MANRSAEEWIEQGLRLFKEELTQEGGLWADGETDRSLWRPKEQKLSFAPQLLQALLERVVIPEQHSQYPLFLQSAYPVPRSVSEYPQIQIHPVHEKREGELVRLSTPAGSIEVEVTLSEKMRADTVCTNAHPLFSELFTTAHDPFSGAPALWGERARLEK